MTIQILLEKNNTYTVYRQEKTVEQSFTIKSEIKDPQTAQLIREAYEMGYYDGKEFEKENKK